MSRMRAPRTGPPCPIEDGMRRSRLPRSLLGTPLVKQDGVRTELGRLSEILLAGLPGTTDRLVRTADAVLDRNRRQPGAAGYNLAPLDPKTLKHARHLRRVLIEHTKQHGIHGSAPWFQDLHNLSLLQGLYVDPSSIPSFCGGNGGREHACL